MEAASFHQNNRIDLKNLFAQDDGESDDGLNASSEEEDSEKNTIEANVQNKLVDDADVDIADGQTKTIPGVLQIHLTRTQFIRTLPRKNAKGLSLLKRNQIKSYITRL